MTTSRRQFLQASATAAAGFWIAPRALWRPPRSPNEKLDLGVVGVANRGAANLSGVAGENIVALCDVDENHLAGAKQKFPGAATYHDFRRMLDRSDLDAVVVSTADHTHAVATMAALESGRHVYCEKPLTHTVREARVVAETARRTGLATQMGTQIHAGANYRRVVELVQSGAVGPVREVHVWITKTWGGGPTPVEAPVPGYLHWDLWLGPAASRPYAPEFHPQRWRHFWPFGSGTLGDMGCHYLDLPFWALDLRHPFSAEATGFDGPVDPLKAPLEMEATWEFPARPHKHAELPPVRLHWYDGERKPALHQLGKIPAWDNGVLFVGDEGMLLADYSRHQLLPEEKDADFPRPEPWIPDSIGHHEEWIEACKTGAPTTCHFGYAGPLTETVLLGLVAYRTGRKLDWDPAALKARNCPEAEALIRQEHREGWTVGGRPHAAGR